MANIRIPQPWELPERLATPEDVYLNRREVLRALGLGALAASLPLPLACSTPPNPDLLARGLAPAVGKKYADRFPAKRNPEYGIGDRTLTPEHDAGGLNNFYELTTTKDQVWKKAIGYPVHPWEGRGLRPGQEAADARPRRRDEGLPPGRAALPVPLRRALVHAGALDRLSAALAPRLARSPSLGHARPVRLRRRPRAPDGGEGEPLVSMALPRGPAPRRGSQSPGLRSRGQLRPRPADAARRPVALGDSLEVRLQGPEVDRQDRIPEGAAPHLLERARAEGVRLLLERQSPEAPSPLEPGDRDRHRHGGTAADAAVQRVWDQVAGMYDGKEV